MPAFGGHASLDLLGAVLPLREEVDDKRENESCVRERQLIPGGLKILRMGLWEDVGYLALGCGSVVTYAGSAEGRQRLWLQQ